MGTDGGLMQPICSVCFDKIVKCASSTGMETERIDTVTTIFNIFLKHGVEVLAEIVKEKLQDQECAPSF